MTNQSHPKKVSKTMKKLKLDQIAIVLKDTNGKYRELILTEEQKDYVISLILQLQNGKILASEKTLDAIEFK